MRKTYQIKVVSSERNYCANKLLDKQLLNRQQVSVDLVLLDWEQENHRLCQEQEQKVTFIKEQVPNHLVLLEVDSLMELPQLEVRYLAQLQQLEVHSKVEAWDQLVGSEL